MPTYNIKNKKTGEIRQQFMSISEMEQYEKDHPEVEILCGSPLIHSGTGMKKPDDGFRDVLRNIKSKHYKSDINTF